jgi:hypothetical protein
VRDVTDTVSDYFVTGRDEFLDVTSFIMRMYSLRSTGTEIQRTRSHSMTRRAMVLAAGLVFSAGPRPLLAHHSFSAEFDAARPVKIDGVVTKVEWTNPHTHFYVDARAENGKPINWELELGSPNMLLREGWNRNSLRRGDHVLVDAFLAKDGSNLANVRDVRLPNGRRVFVGLAGRNTPPLGTTPTP